jgi:hypothetical protein
MNPYIMQQVAATRATDLQKQAVPTRWPGLTPRARRGGMTEPSGI